jgi:dipeptidyl aminopeptidase/acylaminoacyl peptidase
MKSRFFFLLFIVVSPAAYAQDGLVKVTDMLKIKTISNITSSTNGSHTAFVVTSIIPDAANKNDYRYVNHLFMITGDGEPVQLTFGTESASQPAWSPDGNSLAFVRAADQKPQIFILNMSGGEAWQLTKHPYGAANPKWSPDGKKIVFTSNINIKSLLTDSIINPDALLPEWPSERYGYEKNDNLRKSNVKPDPDGNIAQVRAYLENNVADKKATVLNKLDFQDESNISAEQNFSHIYIVNVNRDAQPKMLSKGFYRFSGGMFTPDGARILFTGNIDSLRHPDRSQESEIFMVDTSGADFHLLLGKKDWSYNSPVISPSGKWLAFQYNKVMAVDVPELALIPLAGNNEITPLHFDRNKGSITWSDDERYIYFTAQSNGGSPLYRIPLSTKQVEKLSGYDSGITGFSFARNRLIYSITSPQNPSQLFIADADLKNSKPLGSFNSWVNEKKLSIPEKHSFVNNKGMTVEYWIMKPANYVAGKKYPVLLEMHGGPSAMWGPGEASMWHEFQFFCSKGYGVVYSNPRGSGGYGTEYLRANIGDWGTGPSSDVLGALDRALAEGWGDTSRLCMTGGSYAGYLSAWIVAHDHRFKAACAQRGVYDLATFFGEGNAWRLVPEYFGGYPWEAKVKELLVRESPITYVNQITTPFIIFHGDNDRRTGFVQGEMMFRSLKVLGRPVEYVRHPSATHELTRSGDNRQRMDQMLRTYEFFERWIKH